MRPSLILLPLALATLPAFAATPAKKPVAGTPATKKPASAPTGPHITVDPGIEKAVLASGRSDADRARDRYRHPAQTLSFFGLKPDMTVIEVIPGGGWYTAILAPYLAGSGQLIEAVPPKDMDPFATFTHADPTRYGKVQTVTWAVGQPTQLVPPGTADMVLTFRNIHNLLGSAEQPGDGNAPQAFADWFAALKPGGVLGIEEHRLPETMDVAREKTTGYVKRSTVIRLALAAGFQLAGMSDINANPKDDHDHPKGVWTLPPNYDLGDVDRARYAAIGESDRMTLKFVKPAANPAPMSDAPAFEKPTPR